MLCLPCYVAETEMSYVYIAETLKCLMLHSLLWHDLGELRLGVLTYKLNKRDIISSML